MPTLRELGVDMDPLFWWGIIGPRGIPPDILARLEEALLTAIATPEMVRFLTSEGATPARAGAQEFQRLIASGTARWADVARRATPPPASSSRRRMAASSVCYEALSRPPPSVKVVSRGDGRGRKAA